MQTQPLVSVVTVNYKQTDVTIRMLEALRKSSWQNLQVVLVDNAAEFDQTARYETAFPGIEVINSSDNLGFAGGNNLGLARAYGDYIFLLNNDAFVEADTIAQLVAALVQQPELGAVSPKIKYYGTNQIQYAGFSAISKYTGRSTAFGKWEEDKGQHNQDKNVAYTHGAAMMLTKTALAAAGPMDESYFLYYEELDWCEQMRRHGFRFSYVSSATVHHAASASTGVGSPFQLYYLTRNRLRFQFNWSNPFQFVVFLAYFTCMLIIKVLKHILGRRPAHASAVLRGYADGLKMLIRGRFSVQFSLDAKKQRIKEQAVA